MKRQEYTEANRKAWDEAAPYHARQNQAALLKSFAQPGYSCLDPIETEVLLELGLKGKAVAQLCCNNGREILSLEALGAGPCAGFDISEAFIAQAEELKAAAGASCSFHCTDIYEIGPEHAGAYDLIYVTIGALCWMPDLAAFFDVASLLCKPDGHLFLYDKHPIMDMFEPGYEGEAAFTPQHSYFRETPFAEADGLDYWSGKAYAGETYYSFPHSLGTLLNAIINAGFDLRRFNEYPHDIGMAWKKYEGREAQFPLCYMVLAERRG